MKMFFIFLSAAVLDGMVLASEGRARRQIWPAPADPNIFWGGNGGRNPDLFSNSNSWMGPSRFEQQPGNKNGFGDGFGFGGGQNDRNSFGNDFGFGGGNDFGFGGGRNDRNEDNFADDFGFGAGRNDWNQNSFADDFGFGGGRKNGNQNRRTTTENLGPITSTPRTVHTAPQGCTCPMTQQFNPVCGTDGNTYRNLGLMNCYKRCGTDVSQKRMGRC